MKLKRMGREQSVLHDANLVGDLESLLLLGDLHVGLLGAVRSDQSVDLDWLEVVQLLAGLLYLGLGGVRIDHENEGVVVLDGPDGALARDWELDDGELVVGGELLVRHMLDLVGHRRDVGLRPSELDLGPDLLLPDRLCAYGGSSQPLYPSSRPSWS